MAALECQTLCWQVERVIRYFLGVRENLILAVVEEADLEIAVPQAVIAEAKEFKVERITHLVVTW